MTAIANILVATDLQPKSAGALRHGAYLAGILGAQLHVIHVTTTADLGEVVDVPGHVAGDFAREARDSAERALAEQLQGVLGDGATSVATEVRFGDPTEEILAAARRLDCGYIVVTVENRSAIGKLILGSKAREVLLESEIPVVGVKPNWEPPRAD